MPFIDFLGNNWQELFALTREHILIVLLSTAIAVLIGLPLGILLTRVKALQAPILGIANVMQTVPSLALFGLLIPLPFVGGLGQKPAIIALALYALLPVIRNTVTGILGIDRKVREAAVALGMTGIQVLRLVELPLAAPVILTGVRIAVVIAVGVATVAAAVGAGGLGTYIFRGLRQNDYNLLIAGALASAVLALLFDFALGRIERSFVVTERSARSRRRLIGVGMIAALTVVAIAGPLAGNGPRGSKASGDLAPGHEPIVVASKDFTESMILSEILAQLLERKGFGVTRKFELGGDLAHKSLLTGEVDVYPEYTGTAFTAILKFPPETDPQQVYDRTRKEYAKRFSLVLSPQLGFANDFAILVRGEVARSQGLSNISDAVPLSADWQAGFGQDFMSRADGYPGFVKAYGFNFRKQPREMDLSLTYRALQAGELDIIAGNSTDGLIAALDLVQLTDDRRFFPPYQAVFVARQERASDLADVFAMLANAISTAEMRKMNHEVDGNKRSPSDAAAAWISSKGL
jgi:osmoprotectant transport system permease protein